MNRYVQPNISSQNVEFQIPVDQCGTNTLDIEADGSEPAKRGFENIVVFQNDPVYQEQWDHARLMVCRYSMDDDFDSKDKRVIFKPIVIDMLDVVSIPIEDEDGQQSRVDVWMEINKGRFPHTTDIDGAVKVGSPLTLAIYVKDPRKRTDVRVKDCYAYDDPKVAESNGPALLQLTDFDGCPNRPKLIEVWKRTLDTGDTGATIIAFTTVTAFKFPDRPDLQLTCNIELCRNKCGARCASEMPEPVSVGQWSKATVDDGSGETPDATSTKTEGEATKDEEEAKDEEKTEEAEEETKDEDKAEEAEEEGTKSEEKGDGEEEKTEDADEEKTEDADEEKTEDTESTADEEKEESDGEEATKTDEEEEEETDKTTDEADDESSKMTASEETETKDEEETAAEADGEEEKTESATSGEEEEKTEEAADEEEETAAEDNGNGDEATSSEAPEQEKEPTEETDSAEAEELQEEEIKEEATKGAKLQAKAKKTKPKPPPPTTTTEAPVVVKKVKKTSKKPKAAAKITSALTQKAATKKPRAPLMETSENSIDEIRASEVTKAKKTPNTAATKKKSTKSGLQLSPETNLMSTTTLRPLKELTDFGQKLSKKLSVSGKKTGKGKKATTTTTTSTTTTTETPTTTTTTVKPKKSKKSKSASSNLKRNTRHPSEDETLSHVRSISRETSATNNHRSNSDYSSLLSQPRRNYRAPQFDDTPTYDLESLRNFYAYTHFQPQRIHRNKRRTIRSVDPVQWKVTNVSDGKNVHGGHATLSLGARVISGLEITL